MAEDVIRDVLLSVQFNMTSHVETWRYCIELMSNEVDDE